MEYMGQAELMQKEMKSLLDLKEWLDMNKIDYGEELHKFSIRNLNFSEESLFVDLRFMLIHAQDKFRDHMGRELYADVMQLLFQADRWEWRGVNDWHTYYPQVFLQLEAAQRANASKVKLFIMGSQYIVHLDSPMRQVNIQTKANNSSNDLAFGLLTNLALCSSCKTKHLEKLPCLVCRDCTEPKCACKTKHFEKNSCDCTDHQPICQPCFEVKHQKKGGTHETVPWNAVRRIGRSHLFRIYLQRDIYAYYNGRPITLIQLNELVKNVKDSIKQFIRNENQDLTRMQHFSEAVQKFQSQAIVPIAMQGGYLPTGTMARQHNSSAIRGFNAASVSLVRVSLIDIDLKYLVEHLELQNNYKLDELQKRLSEINDLVNVLDVGTYLPKVLSCIEVFKLDCKTTAKIKEIDTSLKLQGQKLTYDLKALAKDIKDTLGITKPAGHLRYFDVLVQCEPLIEFFDKQGQTICTIIYVSCISL